MKKRILSVCALVLALTVMATPAQAAKYLNSRTNPSCSRFVDADQDGICDNKDDNPQNNFTDADQDGICDNREDRPTGGQGKQHGRSSGGKGRHTERTGK